MKHLTYFLLIAASIMVSIAGFIYGIDRELARRDYVKSIQTQDFEKPIAGCLWESNCNYYTEKLYDYDKE